MTESSRIGRRRRRSVWMTQFDRPLWRWALWGPLIVLIFLAVRPPFAAPPDLFEPGQLNHSAPTTIIATHDFTFDATDPAEVQQLSDLAAEQVLQVWDFDPRVADDVVARIQRVFREGREALAAEGMRRRDALPLRADNPDAQAPSERPSPARARYREDVLDEDVVALVPRDERPALVRDLLTSFGGGAQGSLPDAMLRALTDDAFSAQTEAALIDLVRGLQQESIVETRELIESTPLPITVRVLESATPALRVMHQAPGVLDRDDLRLCLPRLHGQIPETVDSSLHGPLQRLACMAATVNFAPNQAETRRLRDEAAEQARELARQQNQIRFRKGEVIVERGDRIRAETMRLVAHMVESNPPSQRIWQQLVGSLAFLLIVFAGLMRVGTEWLGVRGVDFRDRTMMLTVLALHLWATVGVVALCSLAESAEGFSRATLVAVIPFAAGPLTIRILVGFERAVLYTLGYSLLMVLLPVGREGVAFDALLCGLLSVALVGDGTSRKTVFVAALGSSVLAGALGVAVTMARADATDVGMLAAQLGLAFGSAILATVLQFGLQGLLEYAFRYISPSGLMELLSHNHPLRNELRLHAPGTEDHSVQVSELVVAAADAIGADARLGQVGALFHDVGKLRQPQYFAENQGDHGNPHDGLAPEESAAILRAHITDGIELARRHGLPEDIIDFIREHHGTRLMPVFLHRARALDPNVDESLYRYEGPRPQTIETAICLLADGIEAHTRAVSDRSVENLRAIVLQHVREAVEDGQLLECDLTQAELVRIGDAMHKRLQARYHHRPVYPQNAPAATGATSAPPTRKDE